MATAVCGTVLYQRAEGKSAGLLDWGVVALDAVGLGFLFVLGVIVLAVDFNNGTIYMPSEGAWVPPQTSSNLIQKSQPTFIATSQSCAKTAIGRIALGVEVEFVQLRMLYAEFVDRS